MSRNSSSFALVLATASLFSFASIASAQDRFREDDGTASQYAPVAVSFSAIPNLTTQVHAAPARMVVPLNCPFTLYASLATRSQAQIRWNGLPLSGGLHQLDDEGLFGNAMPVTFSRPGLYHVTATPFLEGMPRQDMARSIDIVVTSSAAKNIRVSVFHTNGPGGGGDDDHRRNAGSNSISNVSAAEAGSEVTLLARTSPEGFESMVEWRVDNKVEASLGETLKKSFQSTGTYEIAAGNGSMELTIYSVDVPIAKRLGIIPEGQLVEFEAVTTPAGFEHLVSWSASTIAGSVSATSGKGASFSVRFDNTFGADGFQDISIQAGRYQYRQRRGGDGTNGLDPIRKNITHAMVVGSNASGLKLRYSIAEAGKASIRVYDVQGRSVRTLLDGYSPASGEASWDGKADNGARMNRGVYFARVSAGNSAAATAKMILN